MPYCNVTLKRIQCTHSGQKWPKNRPDQDDDKSISIFIVTWRWRKSLIVLPTIEAFNETKRELNWLRLLSIKLLKKKRDPTILHEMAKFKIYFSSVECEFGSNAKCEKSRKWDIFRVFQTLFTFLLKLLFCINVHVFRCKIGVLL